MASWKYDRDDQQQHHGMDPVGYDADTQVYTYYDPSTGKYYDTDHGRYGNLRHTHTHPVSTSNPSQNPATAPQSGFNGEGFPAEVADNDWKMMKPFFLLVGVVLLGVFWLMNYAGGGKEGVVECGSGFEKYRIVKGDTCWGIVEGRGSSVERLLEGNRGLVCERLMPGRGICVPVGEVR